MARPTDAELDEIKGHLLLFKDDSSTKIDPVQHDSSTDSQFAAIAAKPEFEDLPFAVIQYDALGSFKSFLHRPDDSWDIGSGGKVSITTAALSLLKDIKTLTAAGLVDTGTTAARLNDLFTLSGRATTTPRSGSSQPARIFRFRG